MTRFGRRLWANSAIPETTTQGGEPANGGAPLVEEDAFGPGWFGSSRELAAGLEVRESAEADAGLADWQHLAAISWRQRPTSRATASPSSMTASA